VGDADTPAALMRRWQAVTVGTLFVGYAGYYVCRANLSVAAPLLVADPDRGLTKDDIGDVASAGVLAYAVGKLLTGVPADALGGRRVFLFGLFASVACTVVLARCDRIAAATGLTILLPLTAAWVANRLAQSMGWGGVVQVAARWFSAGRMATVMGVLCGSYLLGDAAARAYLGLVIRAGGGWQVVFLAAAGTLAAVGVVATLTLKGRPADVDLPEPLSPPGSVYDTASGRDPVGARARLAPLLASPAFWLVALLNAGLTLLREAFQLWTPTYFTEAAGMPADAAAAASAIFPLVGFASALLSGWASDRVGGRSAIVMVPALAGLAIGLAALAALPAEPGISLALVGAVGFCLMGPYTFCSGVLAVRLGGQRGGATAANLIDTAGYIGATLAGSGLGRLATRYGWSAAFAALACVAAVTLAVAVVYWVAAERRRVVESQP
jgi:OPA family glycerol-3-phosphate transporter-like MFS transporter